MTVKIEIIELTHGWLAVVEKDGKKRATIVHNLQMATHYAINEANDGGFKVVKSDG